MATGYPGYNSLVPKSSGSVGEVLKENGYNTSWFGKMHNVPDWMSSQAGPVRSCGRAVWALSTFTDLSVATPTNGIRLYMRTPRPLSRYLGKPDYILDHDLADKAIDWMRMQHALAPDQAVVPLLCDRHGPCPASRSQRVDSEIQRTI